MKRGKAAAPRKMLCFEMAPSQRQTVDGNARKTKLKRSGRALTCSSEQWRRRTLLCRHMGQLAVIRRWQKTHHTAGAAVFCLSVQEAWCPASQLHACSASACLRQFCLRFCNADTLPTPVCCWRHLPPPRKRKRTQIQLAHDGGGANRPATARVHGSQDRNVPPQPRNAEE